MAEDSYTEKVLAWAQALPGQALEFPFGPETAVFKVGGKIFALAPVDGPEEYVTLKIEPDEGAVLRAQYDFVREGYYMNKRHWITIDLRPGVPEDEVRELVENSHRLVVETLPKRLRTQLDSSAR